MRKITKDCARRGSTAQLFRGVPSPRAVASSEASRKMTRLWPFSHEIISPRLMSETRANLNLNWPDTKGTESENTVEADGVGNIPMPQPAPVADGNHLGERHSGVHGFKCDADSTGTALRSVPVAQVYLDSSALKVRNRTVSIVCRRVKARRLVFIQVQFTVFAFFEGNHFAPVFDLDHHDNLVFGRVMANSEVYGPAIDRVLTAAVDERECIVLVPRTQCGPVPKNSQLCGGSSASTCTSKCKVTTLYSLGGRENGLGTMTGV